ncbi:MAG: TolC family protein, partial [Planctomycetales bacterium]|nr:TolC family protein [Planctomycetales bacterium]
GSVPGEYRIDVDPRSRMFDPFDPDCEPQPPDDPASHQLMNCVDCKPGSPCWRCLPETGQVDNPNWQSYLPRDENGEVATDLDEAVRLALLHSPDYQNEVEDLYLSALDVSFERFRFDTQFFGGSSLFYTADGRARGGGNSSSVLDVGALRPGNRLRAQRLFATGGEMVVGVANSLVWQFSGPNDYSSNTLLDFSLIQPLLRGAGLQYNRIAGPGGQPGAMGGVLLARVRTDISLAEFEIGVRDLVANVENAYWDLYFAYRDLEARKMGRDSALETWKKVAALNREGAEGGSADREAQSRAQYFQFKSAVEQGLTDLYRSEARLRYVMGLAMSDGRLIRPADEPTTAEVNFDWCSIHGEAIVRRVEVRKQKWEIKKRELELIAARNHLLPRLDAFGTYRWHGAGDDLINSNGGAPVLGTDGGYQPGSDAFTTLTSGDYQEWEVGAQFSMPIGFRRQLSTVRHHQLLLARDRALLQDLELEVSHQLGDAIRDVDLNYTLTQTNFNRRVAAEREVEAVQAVYDAGRVTLDLLLDAQRRRAEAESAYYRSLTDYNLSVLEVHYRKGSLLDYNGVYLAEGPWPGKAYFDAMRRARQRDASLYLDYGFTRPNVVSRGTHAQSTLDSGSAPVQQEYYPEYQPTPVGPTMMEYPDPLPATGASNEGKTPSSRAVQRVNYEQPAPGNRPRALPVTDGAFLNDTYESSQDYTTDQAASGALLR